MKSEFGVKVEILQIEKGISTKELARRMGMKGQNISKLKARKNPRPETIHKLCEAFDVPAEFFLSES